MNACAQDADQRERRTLAYLATYARPTGHGDISDNEEANIAHRPLSQHVKTLIGHVPFQRAIAKEAPASNAEIGIRAHQGDREAELTLYGRYLHLIEIISKQFGRHPVFGNEDAHQEAVMELLTMARRGAADLPERIKLALEGRVADEAVRHRRALTGYRRDQLTTVRALLDAHDHDHAAAREALANTAKRKRRMSPKTFDALAHLVLPSSPSTDEVGTGDLVEPAGHPGDDTIDPDTALAELFAHRAVSDYDRDILTRYYGVWGYHPHTDAALGRAYGIERSAAGKSRRRALARLRCAAKEVAA